MLVLFVLMFVFVHAVFVPCSCHLTFMCVWLFAIRIAAGWRNARSAHLDKERERERERYLSMRISMQISNRGGMAECAVCAYGLKTDPSLEKEDVKR